MKNLKWLLVLALAGWLGMGAVKKVSTTTGGRPYIGYAYPAGGQQGTTFRIKMGGQGMDRVEGLTISGSGVKGRVIEYHPALNPQDMRLLSEQMSDLRRGKKRSQYASSKRSLDDAMMMSSSAGSDNMMMSEGAGTAKAPPPPGSNEATADLMARIQARMEAYVQRPASAALASIVFAEITVAPDAEPGERELRLVTGRGVSNPLVFYVGQVPEYSRRAMKTAALQVLGKEELAKRKRPESEVEDRIKLPCTVNGQIASGEVNRYRFEARKGQKIVITTQARQLIPYLADAVPGWFQPVLVVHDSKGKELAYDDDFRFKPDPTILFEVPADGEYVFSIFDSIYRGREDFIYRITAGELPFVTSVFPLGARVGEPVKVQVKGWNLSEKEITPPGPEAKAGVHGLVTRKDQWVSNRVPFALDTLPECFEKEPNNSLGHAQKVTLPVIVNGRVEKPDEWDVFQFEGKAGQAIVAEVEARRLDSPLDSVLKITDKEGKLIAFNDDREDPEAGINTHHADSYIMTKLPVDGTYFVHIGDADRHGGEEYGYRLRISEPMPDFALRVVPSSVTVRPGDTVGVNVFVIRKDGFTNTIKLGLENPPPGITNSSTPAYLSGTQAMTRFVIKASSRVSTEPVSLTVVGKAKANGGVMAREAVPAEDRMQAFLWRHLVPAQELKAVAYNYDASYAPKRPLPTLATAAPELKEIVSSTLAKKNEKATFTKSQVSGRLRQLAKLYEEGLFTDAFYLERVAECETAK